VAPARISVIARSIGTADIEGFDMHDNEMSRREAPEALGALPTRLCGHHNSPILVISLADGKATRNAPLLFASARRW